MKKYLALILAIALLAAMPLAVSADELLPYEGDEVVYQGFWDEYNATKDEQIKLETVLDAELKEKVGNVRVEWEEIFGEARQKMDLMMTAGDIPDIIVTVNMFNRQVKYDMSYYLNFNDYAEYAPNILKMYEDYPSFNCLIGAEGEIRWIPQLIKCDDPGENWYVNQDAFDALGVAEPTTPDEVVEVMREYKKQNPDKYPLLRHYGWGLSDQLGAIGHFTGYKGYGVYYDDVAGEWKYGLTSEDSMLKETVELAAMMYEEGLIAPDFLTRTTEQGVDIARNGDFLYQFMYTGTPFSEIFKAGEEVPFGYNEVALPLTVPMTYHAGGYNYDGGLLNADVENPELAVSLVDFWLSEEAQIMNAFGIEGVTYETGADGVRRFLPEYQDAAKRAEFGIGNTTEVGLMFAWARWSEPTYMAKDPANITPNEEDVIQMIKWVQSGEVKVKDSGLYSANRSDEAKEIIAANNTPIQTYIEENLFLFIEGVRPMDEWDAFVEEAKAYGDIEAILYEYNNASLLAYSSDYKLQTVPAN